MPQLDIGRRFIKTLNDLIDMTQESICKGLRGECKKLKEVALDELTGVYNPKAFEKKLKEEISRTIRYRHPLSIAVIDIDNFKRINDNYSHSAGDYVLMDVASIIQNSTRKTIDFVTRAYLKGDEFRLAFPETDYKGARRASEKIKELIENYYFKPIGGKGVTVTIGVTDWGLTFPSKTDDLRTLSSKISPGRKMDYLKDLMNAADKAMFQGKQSGKNKICIYGFA
jgi:diguanylate cyclase (GGDEF)-like protein